MSSATNVDLAALSAADLVVVGTWTDGVVFVGQRPGRQGRMWALPYLTNKRAFVYCTYAVDVGHAVDKLAGIVRDRGAEVVGGKAVHRFHLERDCDALVSEILDLRPCRLTSPSRHGRSPPLLGYERRDLRRCRTR